jgi:TolA-binding protein
MKLHRCILIFALSLVACGQTPSTAPADTAATSAASSVVAIHREEHGPGKAIETNDTAATLITIDLMRGHLIASLENARIQDYTFAQQHASHPLAEQYAQIKSQVQETEVALDPQLETALKTHRQQIEAKADLATLERSTAEINALLNKIEQALVPNHTDVHGRALAGVVATAAEEYQASIKDDAFVAPIAYQHAFGFTRSAIARFGTLKSRLDARAAEETQAALDTLLAAMPTIVPPKTVLKPVTDVETAAREVEVALGSANAAGNDTTALSTGLARWADDVLDTIDAAIAKNDVATARAAWETFDVGWGAIESSVRERSPASYRAIERAMASVADAVVRPEKPVAADVEASTSALRQEIEQFVATLK